MNHDGQAQIEWILSAMILSLVLVGAGWIIQAQWKRTQCAYEAFEATHARLTGHRPPRTKNRVSLTELEDEVVGVAQCGRISETVRFPKLEHAQWQ